MQHALIISLLICSFTITYGQSVSIVIDKDTFKIDEEITVKFEIDAQVDEVEAPEFKDFEIVTTNKSSSVSIVNAVTQSKIVWTYILRAKRSGTFTIESPVFYIKEKKIKATPKRITILENKVTEAEIKEARFNDFIEAALKPEGTYRYILNDEFGYMEVYGDRGWEFYRKLTEEELQLVKQIK